MDSKAVLYVATGDEKYAKRTIRSIESLRNNQYRDTIIVVTDLINFFSKYKKDLNLTLKEVEKQKDKYDSRMFKTSINQYSNAENNLYLDSDTLILGPIDTIWEFISEGDIAFALDPFEGDAKHLAILQCFSSNLSEEVTEIKKFNYVDNRYFNSGVFLWKNNDTTKKLFEEWNKEWKKFRKIDQPSLCRAVNIVRDIKINILPPRFNCTPFSKTAYPPLIKHFFDNMEL